MDIEIFSQTTIVYESWMKMAEAAGGKQLQNEVVMALLRYAFYGDIPDYEIGSKEYLIFMSSVQMIEADKRKKNGGAPKGNTNAKKKQPTKTTSKQPIEFNPKKQPQKQPKNNPKTNNDNGNVNDNVNDTVLPDDPAPPGAGRQAEENDAASSERRATKQYPPEWDLE